MAELTQKQRTRARMPETAAIIDEYRAIFGPDCVLLWSLEGGREVGERSPDGIPASAPMLQPRAAKR